MPVRVYISHSIDPRELALVNSIADITAQRDAIPVIPDRAWNPSSEELPERVAAQIRDSDYLIGVASRWGQHSEWLNQEFAYNLRLPVPKPSLVVADLEIPVASELRCVRIDRMNPFTTLAQVGNEIQRLVSDKQTRTLLKGLLIGSLVLLLLKGK